MTYELYHHGILGMHWGIRRYQNKDGTLTSAGKKRYSSESEIKADRAKEEYETSKKIASNAKKGTVAGRIATKYVESMAKKAARESAIYEGKKKKKQIELEELAKAKTFKDAVKVGLIGTDSLKAKKLRSEADTLRKVADNSYRIAANEHRQNAINAEHLADYYDKRAEMTGMKKVKEMLTKSEYYKTPYVKLSSNGQLIKTTTIGREKVNKMLTDFLGDMVITGFKIGTRYAKN